MKATTKNIKPITKTDELLNHVMKASKIVKKSPVIRTFGVPIKTRIVFGREIEVCPECDTPLTVTKWGLVEESVCAGCGFTATTSTERPI